mmetsp:Transcript_18729/g.47626  ORF Transcript_18729/g.47626 Transcript_18729/m.47626 type:complete len:147 (+) Transcript_18729:85-525(+)
MSSRKPTSSNETSLWEWALFMISGGVGTALFYVAYEALFQYVFAESSAPATYAWVFSYAASIWWQHALHRFLVFGASAPYWRSLFRMYLSYAASLLLSTGLNYCLVEMLHVDHGLAWVAGLLGTGGINYVVVKKFAMSESPPQKQH